MRISAFLLVSFLFSSCFLFKDYKKKKFGYLENGQAASLPILVPKGFLKQKTIDTAGAKVTTFYYDGGAMLYTAYLSDTTIELQPINEAVHQPQLHRLGGLIYKGQDESDLYYREIRRGRFRFGYRFVPQFFEVPFDSATNYASLQKR